MVVLLKAGVIAGNPSMIRRKDVSKPMDEGAEVLLEKAGAGVCVSGVVVFWSTAEKRVILELRDVGLLLAPIASVRLAGSGGALVPFAAAVVVKVRVVMSAVTSTVERDMLRQVHGPE
jgi:hypothetical protein